MRGIDLRLAESRGLRRLRRVLPAGLLACGVLLVPSCVACLAPVAAAAFLLWRALAAVDPTGWRLAWRAGAGWTVGEPGSACPVRLDVLGCFTGSVWLDVVGEADRAGGNPRRRPLCVMADALEEADWRRLRRRLRLDAATAPRAA